MFDQSINLLIIIASLIGGTLASVGLITTFLKWPIGVQIIGKLLGHVLAGFVVTIIGGIVLLGFLWRPVGDHWNKVYSFTTPTQTATRSFIGRVTPNPYPPLWATYTPVVAPSRTPTFAPRITPLQATATPLPVLPILCADQGIRITRVNGIDVRSRDPIRVTRGKDIPIFGYASISGRIKYEIHYVKINETHIKESWIMIGQRKDAKDNNNNDWGLGTWVSEDQDKVKIGEQYYLAIVMFDQKSDSLKMPQGCWASVKFD